MLRVFVLAVLASLIAIGLALAFGGWRWQRETAAVRERLRSAVEAPSVARFDASELDGLPDPVARWFRLVLRDGQPIVTGVRVWHVGEFDMGGGTPDWRPFTSDQIVVTRRPGFDWDARIRVAPGLVVRVRDAYVGGEGELMRFMAEAAWYPTALLPSQGVRWEAVDDRHAHATLVDGQVALTLTFVFGDDGLVESVRAEARGRAVDGRIVPTPWLGRFRDWQTRNGMRVPLEGEVAWILPTGERPYWRGRIVAIDHTFADGGTAP